MKNFLNSLFVLGVITAALLTSCTPKVVTQLVKTYPSVSEDSVLVVEQGQKAPKGAKMVGYVSVLDRSTTTRCEYAHVLKAATKETAKKGGNVLLIDEHLEPDAWSVCHRIDATMLRIDTLPANFKVHPELAALARNKNQHPSTVTKLSFGRGIVASKIVVGSDILRGRGGFEIAGSFENYNAEGVGYGINGFYNSVSLGSYGNVGVFYMGPLLSYGSRFHQHWRLGLQLGIGIVGFIDHTEDPYYSNHKSTDVQAGFGVQGNAGIEYMLSNMFGLGTEIQITTGRMLKPAGFNMSKDEFYGIGHVGLLFGVRYYF